jgi:hypothetical protein
MAQDRVTRPAKRFDMLKCGDRVAVFFTLVKRQRFGEFLRSRNILPRFEDLPTPNDSDYYDRGGGRGKYQRFVSLEIFDGALGSDLKPIRLAQLFSGNPSTCGRHKYCERE